MGISGAFDDTQDRQLGHVNGTRRGVKTYTERHFEPWGSDKNDSEGRPILNVTRERLESRNQKEKCTLYCSGEVFVSID